MSRAKSLHKKSLFLHMGPGLHCCVEREILGQRHPFVEYWDQPLSHSKEHAFTALIGAAEKKVLQMVDQRGESIELIGHSFGGHIAKALLTRIPQLISECHLISTTYNLPLGFSRLLKNVEKEFHEDSEIKGKMRSFLNQDLSDQDLLNRFWEMITLVSADPHFMRFYWPQRISYMAYLKISQKTQPLDINSFKLVLDDFLLNHFKLKEEVPFQGEQKMTIELGDKDPLLILDQEIDLWKRAFPRAQILVRKNSGHFIHLEKYL